MHRCNFPPVQFCFFLFPIYLWLRAECCSTCSTSLPAKCIQVLYFCCAIQVLSHRSRAQTMNCLHQYYKNHRWLPHEVHQWSFSFVSGHQCNSGVSENRPSEQRVSFSEQQDSDICNVSQCSRNLVELEHLDLVWASSSEEEFC